MKTEYILVFQAHKINEPATVKCFEVSTGQPLPKLYFREGDKLHIHLLGPDGTASSMQSVAITFKASKTTKLASPLDDGTQAQYVWHAGKPCPHTVSANGDWDFSAVLLDKDNHKYQLPDPEFQVGDGDSDSPPALLRSA